MSTAQGSILQMFSLRNRSVDQGNLLPLEKSCYLPNPAPSFRRWGYLVSHMLLTCSLSQHASDPALTASSSLASQSSRWSRFFAVCSYGAGLMWWTCGEGAWEAVYELPKDAGNIWVPCHGKEHLFGGNDNMSGISKKLFFFFFFFLNLFSLSSRSQSKSHRSPSRAVVKDQDWVPNPAWPNFVEPMQFLEAARK